MTAYRYRLFAKHLWYNADLGQEKALQSGLLPETVYVHADIPLPWLCHKHTCFYTLSVPL